MRYQLVIFDFDGTLANSFDWVMGVMNEFATRHQFKRVHADEIETLRGLDNRQLLRHLGVPLWKLPKMATELRARMALEIDRISLFEGAAPLLERLWKAEIATAVVSSNAVENVQRVLGPEAAARVHYYGCGASLFGKAAKFRRAVSEVGVPKNAVLCVGDEVRDIDAARSAGLSAAAVGWGYATLDALKARSPDAVFTRFEELAEHLGVGQPAC